MSKFDSIRPYYDHEVEDVLQMAVKHPMMKAMMNFALPNASDSEWKERMLSCKSISDFQVYFAYAAVQQIIATTSDGLTYSGIENLKPNTSYLFISNHRDIILDTSLLNVVLHENNLVMTASAIGNNLVKKDFLLKLSRLNRNFLVQRNLPPRELLKSSKLLSEYINHLIDKENRSVWIAQREGRTKDGNDATHQGVLKMIAMASEDKNVLDYFKNLRIVPISISYEYDPTDALKMPQIMADIKQEIYVKEKNEDFITLMSGMIGQKKGIHIHINKPLDEEISSISKMEDNSNKQIQLLANLIDDKILTNYKLWPTNYAAYDMIHQTNIFNHKYSEKEIQLFERRMELRINTNDLVMKHSFLSMYANPVINKLKYYSIEQL